MIKKIITGVIIIAILGLFGTVNYYRRHYIKLKAHNEVLINNNRAYELECESFEAERGVYKINLQQLESSKDSIMIKLNSLKKELEIKNKELESMTYVALSMKDTIFITHTDTIKQGIAHGVFEPNEYVRIEVTYDGSEFTMPNPKIQEEIAIFNYTKEVWKEPKFLKRLFLFKWGKHSYKRTKVHNNNDLNNITSIKVYEIIE